MSQNDLPPELSCGYDSMAFTAYIKRHIRPGSRWMHKNGNIYTVLMLTNTESDDHFRYPPMVVYRGANGNTWTRKASDWDRSMHRLHIKKTRLTFFRVKMLLLTLALSLTACSEHIDQRDVKTITSVCEQNGGLYSVNVHSPNIYVFCKDGSTVLKKMNGYQ